MLVRKSEILWRVINIISRRYEDNYLRTQTLLVDPLAKFQSILFQHITLRRQKFNLISKTTDASCDDCFLLSARKIGEGRAVGLFDSSKFFLIVQFVVAVSVPVA